MKISNESKTYLLGVVIAIVALFIITGCIFMFLVSGKLDIVMSQPANETYTYFMSIVDRVLLFITILGILPLTIYQIVSKNKETIDKSISIFSLILLLVVFIIFFGGEIYYFKKYRGGELSNSKLFSAPTIETKIFDKILNK